jgi:hypothetical protein
VARSRPVLAAALLAACACLTFAAFGASEPPAEGGDVVPDADSAPPAEATLEAARAPAPASADEEPFEGPDSCEDADEVQGAPPPASPREPSMPLRVVVVDAETGSPVPGVRVEMKRKDVREGAAADAEIWVPTEDGSILVDETGGTPCYGDFRVAAPEGWVACDTSWYGGELGCAAKSLVYVFPLRREADLRVAASTRGEPGPAVAATFVADLRGAFHEDAKAEGGTAAWVSLHGVPFFRGGRLSVDATGVDAATGERWIGSWKGTLPASPHEALRVLVPLVVASPLAEGTRRCGGCGGCSCLWSHSSCGRSVLDVRVLRRGGSPAAWARVDVVVAAPKEKGDLGDVRHLRLDAEGRGRVTKLPAQTVVVRLREPGLVPVSAGVAVGDDVPASVTLREPDGGSVEVVVVGADGLPLPFAELEAHEACGLEWQDVADDGVARMDAFTDHLGRRVLARVEPGDLRVKATWAGLEAQGTASVSDGARSVLRLVLE